MKKAPPAKSPDAYVAALAGWRRALVETLRASALAAGKLEEQIKWGHLVYLSNGPVLLIRAEEKRVLFGFWRGKRLQDIDDRMKPSGKYEMGTIALAQGDRLSAAQAKRLVKAAVGLNRQLGDPTSTTVLGAGVLRQLALKLPDVEDATTDRGIAFTARGRLLVCSATHSSAEPNSLVVRVSLEERPRLMAAYPDALYLTDHYSKHPAVLARLARLGRDGLRDILGVAWLFVTEKALQPKRRRARPKRRAPVA